MFLLFVFSLNTFSNLYNSVVILSKFLAYSSSLSIPQSKYAHSSKSIFISFIITAIVTIIMTILSTIFPSLFRKLGPILGTVLLIVLLVEIILVCLLGLPGTIFDIIIAIVFCGYIGFDWVKAQDYPSTLDNAIDSAADIYVDIVNLFIRILSIIGDND